MTCDSMSYGLLQYFESMHKRFPRPSPKHYAVHTGEPRKSRWRTWRNTRGRSRTCLPWGPPILLEAYQTDCHIEPLLVTNEKVKSLLRESPRRANPTLPFVAVEMANGYKFSRIADPMKLCNAFGKPQALQLVTKYLEKSFHAVAFTKYAKEVC
ncbi:hypothetical protein RRG08_036675 [Elysia crispata]|uniref:Uncharacterized protein n=1 Tax=Elysia crispata TaxID=231223 RepID=A0AAE1DY36_9GAST|nr:hypothetical protein RRG08_036675 [Elysia crispata]